MSEAIEGILREMQETARQYLVGGNDSTSVFEILSTYHDRLKAAYRRDLQSMVDAGDIDMQTATDEVAKLREENEELRTENAQLTEAMSSVVGCADSTCGGMGVCRACKVAQFMGVQHD